MYEILAALDKLLTHHAIERYRYRCPLTGRIRLMRLWLHQTVSEDDKSYRIAYAKVGIQLRHHFFNENGTPKYEVQQFLERSGYPVRVYHNPHGIYARLDIDTREGVYQL